MRKRERERMKEGREWGSEFVCVCVWKRERVCVGGVYEIREWGKEGRLRETVRKEGEWERERLISLTLVKWN